MGTEAQLCCPRAGRAGRRQAAGFAKKRQEPDSGPKQSGGLFLTLAASSGRGPVLGQKDGSRGQDGPGSIARRDKVCHLTPHTMTSGCRVPEDLCQEAE